MSIQSSVSTSSAQPLTPPVVTDHLAKRKLVHRKLREHRSGQHDIRTALLAWAFIRGFSYRRVERHRHIQVVPSHNYGYGHHEPRSINLASNGDVETAWYIEHNRPNATAIHDLLVKVGHFESAVGKVEIDQWLDEPIRIEALLPVINGKLGRKRPAGVPEDQPTDDATSVETVNLTTSSSTAAE